MYVKILEIEGKSQEIRTLRNIPETAEMKRHPMGMVGRRTTLFALLLSCLVYGQESEADRAKPTPDPANAAPVDAADQIPGKRMFGIIPNYRSSPSLKNYEPIPVKEKFKIASQDSFDRGTVLLAAAFAGEGQMASSEKSFGQGVEGYSKYFGAAYGDFVIGNFMTEGIFPTILHQDPRYFRRGHGSGWSRLGYACGQIFWTHNDNGTSGFNYSEVGGNAAAVAIGLSYYKDDRDVGDAVSQLGTQLAVDMVSNVLKEFWPDMDRKFHRKHRDESH
jgi:hypothetical protein